MKTSTVLELVRVVATVQTPKFNEIPNRRKAGIRYHEVAELPRDEQWLLQAVHMHMDTDNKMAAVSLECWLLGRSPAMTVTEAEREQIRQLARERGISLKNER